MIIQKYQECNRDCSGIIVFVLAEEQLCLYYSAAVGCML